MTSDIQVQVVRTLKLLMFVSLICFPCPASTVAIWLNRDGIVAAADSLDREETHSGAREVMRCKIQPAGRFYIASTGYTRVVLEDKVLWSAVEVARSAAASATGMEDLVSRFIEAAEPKFQAVMLRFLQEAPARFLTEVNGKDGVLAVSFFEMTTDGPRLAIISFTAKVNLLGAVQVSHSAPLYCPQSCDLDRGTVARLGIQNASGAGAVPTNTEEGVRWVAAIVKAEIEADRVKSERDKTPRGVGGPISVLTMTRSVTRWPEGYRDSCP